MNIPDIEEVKAHQRGLGLQDIHVCWTNDEEFVLAHTDSERADGVDLSSCAVHTWLRNLPETFASTGYYVIDAPGAFRNIPA